MIPANGPQTPLIRPKKREDIYCPTSVIMLGGKVIGLGIVSYFPFERSTDCDMAFIQLTLGGCAVALSALNMVCCALPTYAEFTETPAASHTKTSKKIAACYSLISSCVGLGLGIAALANGSSLKC